ncbi:MAG: phytanoyl-CoA dioxygenase [Rhodospirillaceae bacterium]|jgi:ectoine hydroxylase-related dioxygenase (phytanoyl-CoA dioxygenase family)|nr:phytanoyl-CoA dioxygenase [Rhodospirillaceae bacterium]MDP6621407.1 phytanoyl-CoA dioxygenase family protein [Alphaproteobacteria bacterium]
MPKILPKEAIESYRKDGFYSPIHVLSEAQATAARARLEAYEESSGGPIGGAYRFKTHLLFPWVDELVRDESILDAVEDVLGPNILCWNTNFFIKEAGDPGFVSWHQDSTYWGLSEPDVVTAWLALSPANEASGAMQMIPGSHLLDQVAHRDTFDEDNLLTRGQEIAVEVNEDEAQLIELEPGEMSLHHVRIFHASAPNRSTDRRIGLAIRYIPTHVSQVVGESDSAALVRGVDDYGHFEAEPRPESDLAPAMLELHQRYADNQAKVLYRGTDRTSF